MRKLDRPKEYVNKSLWVHPSQNDVYLLQDMGKMGIMLFSEKRMVRFDSLAEAYSQGWKEEERMTVQGL